MYWSLDPPMGQFLQILCLPVDREGWWWAPRSFFIFKHIFVHFLFTIFSPYLLIIMDPRVSMQCSTWIGLFFILATFIQRYFLLLEMALLLYLFIFCLLYCALNRRYYVVS